MFLPTHGRFGAWFALLLTVSLLLLAGLALGFPHWQWLAGWTRAQSVRRLQLPVFFDDASRRLRAPLYSRPQEPVPLPTGSIAPSMRPGPMKVPTPSPKPKGRQGR